MVSEAVPGNFATCESSAKGVKTEKSGDADAESGVLNNGYQFPVKAGMNSNAQRILNRAKTYVDVSEFLWRFQVSIVKNIRIPVSNTNGNTPTMLSTEAS